MLIRLLALCLIGLTALFGPSVQDAAAQKKVALVIGIDDYHTVPKLQRAVEDARSVDAALRELGFSVHRIENSNRMAISLALAAFQSQIEKGDTAFVFFAGHGVEIKGQNLLLPADVPEPNSASEGLLKDMGFFTADLIERVTERGARAAFFVIDACRNNPYAQPGSRRSIGATRGLAKTEAPEGVFVLMSAGLGQEALDTLNTRDAPQRDAAKNSVFTRVFLEEFRRPGVTHTEMAKNVQVRVRDLAREVGHSQVPAFTDQILGWVVFREDHAATNIERRPPALINPPAPISPTASISPPAPINPRAPISPPAPISPTASISPPAPINPAAPIDKPQSEEVVRAFYSALARADGDYASSLVIAEKRLRGPFSAAEIKRYYSSLTEPLRLVNVVSLGNNQYQADYTYRAGARACEGQTVVTVVQRENQFLIEGIRALRGC